MSIKRQLTSLIIATVVLASFFAALHGFRGSKQQLDRIFDQELKSVGEFVTSIATKNENLPSDIDIDTQLAFQVFAEKILISRSTNAPNFPVYSKIAGFSDKTFFSERWRTYTVYENGFIVVVAQPLNARVESVESVLFVTITPIVIAIPIIAFLVFYIIRKSLHSLIMLSNALKTKNSNDLTVVYIDNPPEEIIPVIDRLNQLLRRVNNSFEREKQLTANAAHELRTPISVLTITAHNIAEDFKNDQLHIAALDELSANIDRMAHVIEQMIALFRYTPEQFSVDKRAINLQNLLQDLISNNFDDIEKQHQTISLDAEDAWVLGEQFALYTAFENVLRNAIKYSGANAEIRISLRIKQNEVSIDIEDSGSGIDSAEYKKIFDRFYRAPNSQSKQKSIVKGSGLGLSIVKHIVELHEGTILCEPSALGGLKMQICLPIHQDVKCN